jgi:hypothetical protein
MYTRYFCSICNTKPDQISHHKSHLLTQKHIENRDKHEKELKYFSMFKIVHPDNWLNHDEIKEMIFEEYGKELTKENKHDILISMLNVIDKFVKYKPPKIFYLVVDGKPTTSFVEPSLVYNFETGLNHTTNRVEYLEWCIEKILKSKETIREKSIKTKNKSSLQRIESIQRSLLSKVTSLNYDILKQIRLNEHNLNYFTPKGFIEDFLQFVIKPNFLKDDNVLKYACVLFNAFGVSHLTKMDKYKFHETSHIYFHKLVSVETTSKIQDVEGYEKKIIMPKKIWVKTLKNNCYENFIYVEDQVVQIKFRDYLIEYYTIRKEELENFMNTFLIESFKKKWEEELIEVNKDIELVSNMLMDSELFKNTMKLCETFLIESFKKKLE